MRSRNRARLAIASVMLTAIPAGGVAATIVEASAHVGDIKVTTAKCVDATSMSATYTVGWNNGTATGKLYQRSGTYGQTGNAGSSTSGWTFVKNVSGAANSDTFTITHPKSAFSGTNAANGPWWSSKVIFSDGYGVAADTRVENFDWNKCGTKVAIPAQPEKEDPCNPPGVTSNIRWKSVPSSTPDYTVTGTDTSDLTLTLKDPTAQWTDGTKAPKVFVLGKDSGEKCPPKVVPVPGSQDSVDKCNPPGVTDNVIWAAPLPASNDDVIWTESADGKTRTATLRPDRVWSDKTTAPKVFTRKTDSGELCPTAAPTAPSGSDYCEPASGPTQDSYTVPVDVNFTYTLDGTTVAPGTYPATNTNYTLVAVPKPGVYVTPGAKTSFPLEFSKVKCTVTVQPPTIPVVDECGPNNAHYGPVPVGPWTAVTNPGGSVTVTANSGNTFPNGPSVTYPAPVDSNVACPVPPTYDCPPGKTWVDKDHDGIKEPGECVKPGKASAQMWTSCKGQVALDLRNKTLGPVTYIMTVRAPDGAVSAERFVLKAGKWRSNIVRSVPNGSHVTLKFKGHKPIRVTVPKRCGTPDTGQRVVSNHRASGHNLSARQVVRRDF